MPTLKVDPAFRDLCPPLTEDERKKLTASIIADGCLDPIKVWEGIIVDGMNRYEICVTHEKQYGVTELSFADRDEAIEWIVNNQLGRRNLSSGQKQVLLAQSYKLRKKSDGSPPKEQQRVQIEPVVTPTGGRTSAVVAAQHGVSESAVKRAVKFEKLLESTPKAVAKAIRDGEIKYTNADVAKLAKLPNDEQEAIVSKAKAEKLPLKVALKPPPKPVVVEDDGEKEAAEEPTLAECCEEDNRKIESFCRSLVRFYEEKVPHVFWAKDANRISSALSNIKAACVTLRAAKSIVCPACSEGMVKNAKCQHCRGVGYLPSHYANQVPANERVG